MVVLASVRASVSVCVRARARLCRRWVGVRACELACRRRGSPGLRRQPVDRTPGGKLPQPPGPPALPSPGQVSAPRGPRFVPRLRPGPAQVTRRWPRVTWVWVGAREGLQGMEGSKLPQSRVRVDVERQDSPCPAARSSRTTSFSRTTP